MGALWEFEMYSLSWNHFLEAGLCRGAAPNSTRLILTFPQPPCSRSEHITTITTMIPISIIVVISITMGPISLINDRFCSLPEVRLMKLWVSTAAWSHGQAFSKSPPPTSGQGSGDQSLIPEAKIPKAYILGHCS